MGSFSRCRPPLLLLLCCGVAETRPEAIAAEPDPRGTYLTLQISTPLQKRVAGDGVTVVAAINGDALVEDSTIRAGRIDLELWKQLFSRSANGRTPTSTSASSTQMTRWR